MTPMRIGLLSGEYPPMQGGVGDFTRELASALAAQGHQVHVITHADARPQTIPFAVHPLVRRWGWRALGEITALVQSLELEVVNIQYQAAAYQMRPPIHLLPWWWRRSLETRPCVVVTFHDLRVPGLFRGAGLFRLRARAIRFLASQADGVIVTNREDELAIQSWEESAVRRLAQIPIGSNIAPNPPPDYNRDAWRRSLGIGPRDLLIGYFGFLNASKGVDTLIRALALLMADPLLPRPVHLLMIGGMVGSSDPTNQAYAEQIQALIQSLNLEHRVRWTGFVPDRYVSGYLLTVDLCVLPYVDGVSFRRGSLMACLAHGRPIITTYPRVELPELRDGENVLLVPPRDAPAIARAVVRVAGDARLWNRLSQGALRLARRFRWEEIAARTVAFFQEVAQEA
ncbi:MAG: glycosyltransferase [Chloroflexi bacterium]|nr:MAG: glycosyltransferase [Chloroflexota bacterium]